MNTELENVKNSVENNSSQIQEIVEGIIKPYCKDLDNYVDFIKSILDDGENPPTSQELDDFCMNLSVYIYYASGMQEQLGIKDDIARAIDSGNAIIATIIPAIISLNNCSLL